MRRQSIAGPRRADAEGSNDVREGAAIAKLRLAEPPRRQRPHTEGFRTADSRRRIGGDVEGGRTGKGWLTRIAPKRPALRVPDRQPREQREKSGAE